MKIINLKKFIRSICLVLLIIFILSLTCTKSTFSHKEVEYTKLYITEGDTLWSIAKDLQNNNEYYMSKDIREIIYSIKTINNLQSSNLLVNQEILIPVV